MRQGIRGARWVVLAVAAAAPLVLTGSGVAGAQVAGSPEAGGTWTQTSPAIPAGTRAPSLSQVTCPAKNYCVAIGGGLFTSGGGVSRLTELWNGSTWTSQSTPSPAGTDSLQFLGVSCVHPTFCMQVGYYGYDPLIERWNGKTWTMMTTPAPTGEGYQNTLGSVSCSSTTSCLAVGTNSGGSTPVTTFVDSWNGTAWTLLSAPGPEYDAALACTSSTSCEAVSGNGDIPATAEGWNGTAWTTQPVPLPAGTNLSALTSVWCGSATDCVAVGDYRHDRTRPLAEAWDGTAWTMMPVGYIPNLKTADLSGVSCGSASDCTAVGTLTPASAPKTTLPFAMHWNGTKWAVDTPAAPADSLYNGLSGVACRPAADCTAVGGTTSTKKKTTPLAVQEG
jgi:hypothetical protein